MIPLQRTSDPSPHVRRRSKTMRVKTLAFDSYEVSPREPGKDKRLVQFDMSDTGVVKIECVKIGIGEVCEANTFNRHCSHVEAALRRLTQNIKREEKKLDRSKKVRRAIKQNTSKRLPI